MVDALFVTEHGVAYSVQVVQNSAAGLAVHDPQRTNYYQTDLAACAKAIEIGIPLKGYFAWSLMDNFERGQGTSMRIGLTHVDFETQTRRSRTVVCFIVM